MAVLDRKLGSDLPVIEIVEQLPDLGVAFRGVDRGVRIPLGDGVGKMTRTNLYGFINLRYDFLMACLG